MRKIRVWNTQKGFTLIELLSAIIVLVAIGVVVVGIITSSLRGTNKTKIIENIRQNGNYTISQISKDIQFAQVFDGFSNNGTDYDVSCFSFSVSPTPSSSGVPYKYLKVSRTAGASVEYYCAGSDFTANGDPLINEDLLLTDCIIKCIQKKSTDVPIIEVSFVLGQTNSLIALPETSTPPIKFKTSVSVRNYKK